MEAGTYKKVKEKNTKKLEIYLSKIKDARILQHIDNDKDAIKRR